MIFLIINHILLLDINGFSTEVWAILDKLVEDPYNFQNNGYKSSYPIAQLIFQFGNNSFNIKKLKVCFKNGYYFHNNFKESSIVSYYVIIIPSTYRIY